MLARLRAHPAMRHAPLAAVVIGFAVSRAAYYAAGIRFDASPLIDFWQYIDPALLRDDLWSSLWHLHTQPPLYNLYLGVVLKAGGEYVSVFHWTYLLAGLAMTLALFALLNRLGVGRWWSVAAAVAFAASPPTVLFENWLYVEYFVAAGLVAGALFLLRFAAEGRTRDLAAAFALFGAIVLSRPLFHLVWLLLLVAVVALLQPLRRRQLLLVAALPVLVCVLIYGKNLVEWSSPSATTCLGNNLFRVMTLQLDEPTRRRLVRDGELSAYALQNPLTLIVTAPKLVPRERPTGVALLDRVRKSTGAENLDAKALVKVCDAYSEDALHVARTRPSAFAHGIATGSLIYMRPSSDYYLVERHNGSHIHGLERAFATIVFGQFDRTAVDGSGRLGDNLAGIGWFIPIAYLLALGASVATLRHARRHRELSSPEAMFAAFFLLNLVWVTAAGNLLEAGENNRFRFLLDPLTTVVLVVWLRNHARNLIGRRRAA
jgi:4-amino-4-deoxy-L-arabinose transferase-like glycosyltransferase